MKHYVYIFCFLLFCLSNYAQTNTKRDKIDELRVAFISNKVNLTPTEAQQFWPLYNEYNDKLDAIKSNFKQNYFKKFNAETLTDKEAEALLVAELLIKQKEIDLYKEYYEKYKKVVPIKKIALIKMAEHDFRKELIKNIKGTSPE